jgi:hypothetical protein
MEHGFLIIRKPWISIQTCLWDRRFRCIVDKLCEREAHERYSQTRIQNHRLALDERPRERLAHLGAQALASSELLANLLRVGETGENAVQVGQRLLNVYGGISGIQRAPFEDLCNQRGIGEAKAAQIKAAMVICNSVPDRLSGSVLPEARVARLY